MLNKHNMPCRHQNVSYKGYVTHVVPIKVTQSAKIRALNINRISILRAYLVYLFSSGAIYLEESSMN